MIDKKVDEIITELKAMKVECTRSTGKEVLDAAIQVLQGNKSDEQIVLQKIATHKSWQWVSVADAEVIKNALQQASRKGKWTTNDFGDILCPFCGGLRRDCRSGHTSYCNYCGAKLSDNE